jgi:hypothetical protein
MPPQFTEIPETTLWAQSIGGLILNFGMAEFLTLRCVQLLSGEDEAIRIRHKSLSTRITSAKDAIKGSEMPDEQKYRALSLWTEIASFTKMRNRIAHNPLAAGRRAETGELVYSVVDLKRMSPSGRNQLDPLDYQEIARTAVRVRDIVQELTLILEPAAEALSNS